MALNILPGEHWASELGREVGAGAGKQVSGGIQALLEHKLEQISERKQEALNKKHANRLTQAGYPENIAHLISSYGPKEQIELLKNYQPQNEEEGPEENEQGQQIMQALLESPQGQQINEMLQQASPDEKKEAMQQLQEAINKHLPAAGLGSGQQNQMQGIQTQNPIAQTQQQKAEQPKQNLANKKSKLRAPLFNKGKEGLQVNVKLSPLDEKYAERVETRAEAADEIEPILNRIETILNKGPYTTKNPEGYNYGYLEEKSPVAWKKNATTQTLNNLLNDLVTKQSALQSEGRGSNLLRQMIKDGKLSLAQNPESLNDTFARLKDANEKDKKKSEVLESILENNDGKPVSGLRKKVQQQFKEQTQLFIDEAGTKWKMINGKPVRA